MLEKKTKKLITDILKILQPPPDLDVMEWADMNRVLSKESAAEPGRWSTARTPYMIEIYKTVTKICSGFSSDGSSTAGKVRVAE